MATLGRSLLVLCLVLRASAAAQDRFTFSQLHMGLQVRITLYAGDTAHARAAAQQAFGRIAQLEQILSDYRPASELSQLGATAYGTERGVVVSEELFRVLTASLVLAEESDGAFDPTVGPLSALWRRARTAGALPGDDELAEARTRVGWRLVSLDSVARRVQVSRPDMRIDLGGIAKGYILDEALHELATAGATRAMIEAGGDIVVGAAPPGRDGWTVAVPDYDGAVGRRASALVQAALSTSGPTEQFVEIDGVRYSHVVDPRTGLGLTRQCTVHVVAATGLEADGLATALAVLGAEEGGALLSRRPDVDAAIDCPEPH